MGSNVVLFSSSIFMGVIISFCSSNWVMCWVGLELLTFSLIPIFYYLNKDSCAGKESIMKYFLAQSMASGIILFSGVFLFNLGMNMFVYFFLFGVMLKLGVFPGYFWVLSVFMGLDMLSLFLLMVLSKVIPLMLITEVISVVPISLLLTLSFISMIVGAFIGLNQSKLKMMLGASSIGHGGWFLAGGITGDLWFYFFLYGFSCLIFVLTMSFNGSYLIKFLTILSISGLPPFLLFNGKVSILSSMVNMNPLMILIPCLMAVLSMFFYLKFSYVFLVIASSSIEQPYLKFFGLLTFLLFGSLFYWFVF